MPNRIARFKASMRSLIPIVLFISSLMGATVSSVLWAQESDFPNLTGRVVDVAGLLNEAEELALTDTLAAHEAETSNQIVVVTVPNLNGYDISGYANRLGREWEIGTAEEDNGIILLVAPNARKVRIEVGYGLEGALTDSLSSVIIQQAILPEFRKNNFPAGISNGVDTIIKAIKGEYTAPVNASGKRKTDAFSDKYGNYVPLFFIAIVGIPEFLRRKGYRRASNGAFPAGFAGLFGTLVSGNPFIGIGIAIAVFLFVYFVGSGKGGGGTHGGLVVGGGFGGSRGGFGGGGFGGGGFSGGGGSFGGGGASGSW